MKVLTRTVQARISPTLDDGINLLARAYNTDASRVIRAMLWVAVADCISVHEKLDKLDKLDISTKTIVF